MSNHPRGMERPWSGSPAPQIIGILWKRLNSVSLWVKIMGMTIGVAMLVGILSALQAYHYASANLREQLGEKSLSIAREQAAQAEYFLLVHDLFSLHELLKNTKKNRPDIRYLIFQDQQGEILAHSFENGFPVDLLPPAGVGPVEERTIAMQAKGEIIWESIVPIMGGSMGTLRVGVSDREARSLVRALMNSLALGTLLVIVLAIASSALLTRLLTKPINRLLTATCAIRSGNYNTTVAHPFHDEIGNLIEAFNVMAAQLKRAEEVNREKELLRSDFLKQIIAGQEEERKRIARELHDQTGQALVSFMVMLKMLENASTPAELGNGLQQLKIVLAEEMEKLHQLTIELRPSVLDDMGLAAALAHYIKEFKEKHDIDIELTILGFEEKRPAPHVEISIYRIIQEALINVLRHAAAKKIRIILEWRSTDIRGVVEDDGRGFEVVKEKKGRLGLYGMEERARLLDGSFRIHSEPDEGTLVIFSIPQQETPHRDREA